MTQVFDAEGAVHPVTVLAVGKIAVTQVKTAEKDGYVAVQVGYGEQKEHRINKAQKAKGNFRGLREFRIEDTSGMEVGKEIGLDSFKEGDKVTVSAVSKGKGFQGVVKRHGFAGGPRTHGQKHSERERGSSGGGPGRAGGRVVKGIKMPGRMGGETVTVRNLKVVRVDSEKGELLLEGAVPGKRGTLVEVTAK